MWWVVGWATAHAQADVVLYQTPGLRPDLCVALRIQLSGVAKVLCRDEVGDHDLAERLARAGGSLRAEGARLGVLLERDPDPGRVRMYTLSNQSEQAVIAIERIENRADPDIDRSLALKVRDAYEVFDYVSQTRPAAKAPVAAVLAPSSAQTAELTPALAPRQGWVALVDVGGGLSLGPARRPVGGFFLGIGHVSGPRRLELAIGARVYASHTEGEEIGSVTLRERGPVLSARLLYRFGRVELGAAIEPQLSFMDARGVARDGTRGGTKRLLTPLVGLAVDLRLRLFSSAYLRLAPGIALPVVRQELEVDRDVVLEEDPVRVELPLSLMFMLPVRGTAESLQP